MRSNVQLINTKHVIFILFFALVLSFITLTGQWIEHDSELYRIVQRTCPMYLLFQYQQNPSKVNCARSVTFVLNVDLSKECMYISM